MRNKSSLGNVGWALLFVVFLLVACSSTPTTQFYKLNSLPSGQQENPAAILGDDIAIGVGPVELPEFLDRPQIVTRKSQNRLEISEFHRWATSFPRDFSRVLAKNISTLLPTNRVEIYPWADNFSPIYQIKLEVEQFDGRLGEQVFLRVIWSVVGEEGVNELMVRKTLIEEPVLTNDYEGLVAAKSNALATLSREIAEEIRRLGI
jgi:uncharacterized lipoprotein YmbA